MIYKGVTLIKGIIGIKERSISLIIKPNISLSSPPFRKQSRGIDLIGPSPEYLFSQLTYLE